MPVRRPWCDLSGPDETRRYDPSDLDFFMVGEGPAANGGLADVAGLVWDIDAEPPGEKLASLFLSNPKFPDTWNRRRMDLQDQSASGYDLALADAAAIDGWGDQEIFNLLIAWRREHGESPEKLKRPDVVARALGKAHKWREQNETPIIIHLNGRRMGDGVPRVPETREDAKDTSWDTDEDAERDTPKRRYTLHHAREAWAPEPPREFLVNPLFERGSLSIIYGPPGCGKTYAMIDCAVCIALGLSWLNFETVQGGVLILDEESGQRRMNRRLREVMKAHDAPDDVPIYYTTLEGFNLRDVRDHKHIEAAIEESGAGFVLMDALADFTPGADENAVKDMLPPMLVLKGIADRRRVHVSTIHHSNKQGAMRGSIAIPGVVDLVLSVERKPKSPRIDFVTTKARDTEEALFSATFDFDRDEQAFQLLATAKQAGDDTRLTDAQKFVLHHLLENGPSTIEDIESHASGCSPRTARNAVFALANMGRIHRTNPGESRGVPAVYGLTPKERF